MKQIIRTVKWLIRVLIMIVLVPVVLVLAILLCIGEIFISIMEFGFNNSTHKDRLLFGKVGFQTARALTHDLINSLKW